MNMCASKFRGLSVRAKDVLNAPFRMVNAALLALMTAVMMTCPSLCATINSNLNMDTLFGSIVNVILKIAFWTGALIAVGGVFQLVLAYKDDNADGQTRAVRLIVVGIILVGFEAMLKLAGIIA